jgi:uncharacterized protein
MDKKRFALITGASAGLGEQFAYLFAKDKISVVLVARREDRLKKIKADLESKFGIQAEILAADLTDPDFSNVIQKFLDSKNISIEFLVNNAGYGQSGTFMDISLEHNLGQIDLNVRALTDLTYKLLPAMKSAGRGRILNIGSTAGFQPGPFMTVYYATKAYVNSFSEALFYELKNTGITVTLSCPGPTFTEFGAVSGLESKRLFKRTAMTAELVAHQAYQAMLKGKRIIIHGANNKFGVGIVRMLPKRALLNIVATLNNSK